MDEESYETECPGCDGGRACDECRGTGRWPNQECPYYGGLGICFHCEGNGYITEWD
jgi:hypothetical protein